MLGHLSLHSCPSLGLGIYIDHVEYITFMFLFYYFLGGQFASWMLGAFISFVN